MTETTLKRQFITDEAGNAIGVILPLKEFQMIEDILEERYTTSVQTNKLELMEQATHDPLFMDDLRETMSAFANVIPVST